MRFDHVAVPANDIPASVEWYKQHFAAEVLYQDKSWAFLKIGGSKLALITPGQHPPHIAMSVTVAELDESSRTTGIKIDSHRDGTRGIYLEDPSGNAVELIAYPPGETAYAGKSL